MNVVDLLLGGAGGGIIGTIGSFVNKWVEGKSALELEKERNRFAIQEKDRDLLFLKAKLGSANYLAELERDKALDKTAGESLVASIEADAATYSTVDSSKASKWLILVDVVRGLMRPGLTIGLTSLNGYLSVILLGKISATSSVPEQILLSTATLAGMSVAWWFGARSHAGK